MAYVLQTTFWVHVPEGKVYWLKISLKFVPSCPIDNTSALIKGTGDKTLPEPMVTNLRAVKWVQRVD